MDKYNIMLWNEYLVQRAGMSCPCHTVSFSRQLREVLVEVQACNTQGVLYKNLQCLVVTSRSCVQLGSLYSVDWNTGLTFDPRIPSQFSAVEYNHVP